jgi:predicted DNA-binding protein (MmcQ/YjbR family)
MLSEAQILERLRKTCRDLPGASETVTFGHPTFQVNGKTFSVLEEYKSELGICVKLRRNHKLFSLPIRAFFPRPTSGSTAGLP